MGATGESCGIAVCGSSTNLVWVVVPLSLVAREVPSLGLPLEHDHESCGETPSPPALVFMELGYPASLMARHVSGCSAPASKTLGA